MDKLKLAYTGWLWLHSFLSSSNWFICCDHFAFYQSLENHLTNSSNILRTSVYYLRRSAGTYKLKIDECRETCHCMYFPQTSTLIIILHTHFIYTHFVERNLMSSYHFELKFKSLFLPNTTLKKKKKHFTIQRS